MKKVWIFLLILLPNILSDISCAWTAVDVQTGTVVDINNGLELRKGNYVWIYDYGAGRYKYVFVQDTHRNDITVYDYELYRYRTFYV